MNKLFVSVDMDEWYLARWATGSKYALWKDLPTLFKEVYGQDKPIGEIYKPTDKILELFDELDFKSTFFFTGTIANFYPDLVKKISNLGHEIACHNMEHLDYEYETREKFKEDLKKSKNILEDLTGNEVIGYRSPNSSVPITIVEDLEEAGFKYDSSVTPTRRFMGKFGKFTDAPLRPYNPDYKDIGKEGNAELVELPWAVFPLFKLPAGSGIMHRIAGNIYNSIATKYSLKHGSISYYFHPYELNELNLNKKINLKTKIFNRNLGDKYFKSLSKFLRKRKDVLVNGRGLYNLN